MQIAFWVDNDRADRIALISNIQIQTAVWVILQFPIHLTIHASGRSNKAHTEATWGVSILYPGINWTVSLSEDLLFRSPISYSWLRESGSLKIKSWGNYLPPLKNIMYSVQDIQTRRLGYQISEFSDVESRLCLRGFGNLVYYYWAGYYPSDGWSILFGSHERKLFLQNLGIQYEIVSSFPIYLTISLNLSTKVRYEIILSAFWTPPGTLNFNTLINDHTTI